jgi:arsenite methyltransferase
MQKEEIKKQVRENYGKIARGGDSCCGTASSGCGASGSCCGTSTTDTISKRIGYADKDIKSAPEGANLGLGCGNPVALASLKDGDVVLDLGSGAGFDCFLASERVGKTGKVIGVDMTAEMLEKARKNAEVGNYNNVEFRLGEIENLPVADNAINAIISNCVINLSPDKPRVFQEAFRVLKPGGKLMVSDIVLLNKLPDVIMNSISAYVGCIAGALLKDEYINTIKNIGFKNIQVIDEKVFPTDLMLNDPTVKTLISDSGLSQDKLSELANLVLSISVFAIKP